MTHIKLGCMLLFLGLLLTLPATHSVNALSASSVRDAGRDMITPSGILHMTKAKRSFCATQFQKCVAQCKKGAPAGMDACKAICTTDEWWCSAFCPFGPNPC